MPPPPPHPPPPPPPSPPTSPSPPPPSPCYIGAGEVAGRTNTHALGKSCGAFRSRADCEKFFFWFDFAAEEEDAVSAGRDAAAAGGYPGDGRRVGPPRFGSCGWDTRVRRCTVLPMQKEPCLLAAAGIGVGGDDWAPGAIAGADALAFTPSREYSKRFET